MVNKMLSPMVFIEDKEEGNHIDYYRWIIVHKNSIIAVGGWHRQRDVAVSEYNKLRSLLEMKIFPGIMLGKFNPDVVGGVG